MVQRSIDFKERIEGFSAERASHRLARALLRLSERLGTPQEDGSMRIVSFTHELLSQYVGTTRELVTHYMNQFRRDGALRYSRRDIIMYPRALSGWLSREQ
jgi:CRP-like cAMP-binding protein